MGGQSVLKRMQVVVLPLHLAIEILVSVRLLHFLLCPVFDSKVHLYCKFDLALGSISIPLNYNPKTYLNPHPKMTLSESDKGLWILNENCTGSWNPSRSVWRTQIWVNWLRVIGCHSRTFSHSLHQCSQRTKNWGTKNEHRRWWSNPIKLRSVSFFIA